MMRTMPVHPRLVEALRKDLCLSADQATDDEVLRLTEGSFTRARLELGLAAKDFTEDLSRSVERIRQCLRRLSGH
jgi:hypothetical protein